MARISRINEEEKLTPKKEKFRFTALGKKIIKDILSDKKRKHTEDGKLIRDSINRSINFNPDLMFEQMVENYQLAEKIYGKSILRKLSNYDPNYIEKNINIPEFKKELKDVPGLKLFFKLRPPEGGFERKGVKHPFSMGGVLGYRKEKINELLMRML